MFSKLFLMFPISNICENICVKINILIPADVSMTLRRPKMKFHKLLYFIEIFQGENMPIWAGMLSGSLPLASAV